jgi:hypothetical protein
VRKASNNLSCKEVAIEVANFLNEIQQRDDTNLHTARFLNGSL